MIPATTGDKLLMVVYPPSSLIIGRASISVFALGASGAGLSWSVPDASAGWAAAVVGDHLAPSNLRHITS